MFKLSLPVLSNRPFDNVERMLNARKLVPADPKSIGGLTRLYALELASLVRKPQALAERIRQLVGSVIIKPQAVRNLSRVAAWIESGMSGKLPHKAFSKGNSKLPFYAFSTLPVVTCPGAGECLSWCYSFTSWRIPAAFTRQLVNTLLVLHRREQLAAEFGKLRSGVTVRLYVDGDFDSVDTVAFWMRQLAARPDIKAYGYSKSWTELVQYSASGNAFPSNYKLNMSSGSCHDNDAFLRSAVSALTCTRGRFVAVPVQSTADYTNKDVWREHAKYVRQAVMDSGLGRVFVCPGRCGTCTIKGHACGLDSFRNVTIAIGIH